MKGRHLGGGLGILLRQSSTGHSCNETCPASQEGDHHMKELLTSVSHTDQSLKQKEHSFLVKKENLFFTDAVYINHLLFFHRSTFGRPP